MARPIKVITAGAEIWAELQRRANAPTSAHRDRFRAKIILLRLEGLKIATVAKRLKTSMPTVSTWSARFEAHGLERARTQAVDYREENRACGHRRDAAAEEPKTLERAEHGPPRRCVAQYRVADLVEERPEAARREEVQAVE